MQNKKQTHWLRRDKLQQQQRAHFEECVWDIAKCPNTTSNDWNTTSLKKQCWTAEDWRIWFVRIGDLHLKVTGRQSISLRSCYYEVDAAKRRGRYASSLFLSDEEGEERKLKKTIHMLKKEKKDMLKKEPTPRNLCRNGKSREWLIAPVNGRRMENGVYREKTKGRNHEKTKDKKTNRPCKGAYSR